jgi:hypothetical protein
VKVLQSWLSSLSYIQSEKREFFKHADQAFGEPYATQGVEQLEQECEQLFRKIGEL